jgi:hypothetical protein
MNTRSFCLKPFPSARALPDVKITGSIARRYNTLAIRYSLLGAAAELVVPAPAGKPARRQGLWEETCFELFVAVRNAPRYWEFNLSPTGHWNVYRFADYRQGMQEEPAFAALPFDFRMRADSFALALECPLDGIIPGDQPLEVAISVILKQIDGALSYWALAHPGLQPDFHRRDGFTIQWAGTA